MPLTPPGKFKVSNVSPYAAYPLIGGVFEALPPSPHEGLAPDAGPDISSVITQSPHPQQSSLVYSAMTSQDINLVSAQDKQEIRANVYGMTIQGIENSSLYGNVIKVQRRINKLKSKAPLGYYDQKHLLRLYYALERLQKNE